MERIEKLKLFELYYMVNAYAYHTEDVIPYDIYDVWKRINDSYKLETNKSLDIIKEENRNTLYLWLQNKARYDLLNELIIHIYNRLINKNNESKIDNTDLFFASNINSLWTIMNEYYQKISSSISYNTNKLAPSVSKKETITTVKDILSEIDSNNEWLNIYEEAISKNRIIYLNELSDEEINNLENRLGIKSLKDIDNSCMQLENNETYIFLNYSNTLYDIPTTIHELTHYISRLTNKNNLELPVLREFPAIFFEQYSLEYLKKIGYSNEDIAAINQGRLVDTANAFNEIKDLMYYLNMFLEKGHISERQDYINTLKEIKKQKKKLSPKDINALLLEDPNLFNVNKRANNRCDNVTENLVINPFILFNNYPYIIGSYLSDMATCKINSRTFIAMMKYITEKISKMDAFDIFSILEYPKTDLVPTNYTYGTSVKKRRKLKTKM